MLKTNINTDDMRKVKQCYFAKKLHEKLLVYGSLSGSKKKPKKRSFLSRLKQHTHYNDTGEIK